MTGSSGMEQEIVEAIRATFGEGEVTMREGVVIERRQPTEGSESVVYKGDHGYAETSLADKQTYVGQSIRVYSHRDRDVLVANLDSGKETPHLKGAWIFGLVFVLGLVGLSMLGVMMAMEDIAMWMKLIGAPVAFVGILLAAFAAIAIGSNQPLSVLVDKRSIERKKQADKSGLAAA